ncbi:MAG: aquaporin [Caldilinea sp.]|uniref:aquaporin n=1 Tax=Caldilinea sp. TaxID=2293560 RepID=UPI002B9A5419|nr:aquaporin [Anaerolineales bacterium]HQY90702.1 aquaporin [Caldilinea sp.]HRA65958.1 aquaporin [Caldilinea sp.]
MPKYITEFIGAFFLVFTVAAAAVGGWAPLGFAPLAIGSVLMVMIFAGGHISGAHYNPAVSMAVFVRGKISATDMIIYWVVQLVAGVAAALLATSLLGITTAEPAALDMTKAITAEFLFTFALAFVVLNVATAKGTDGNSFYGLAIGFTVLAGAYAVGSISGGVFNPAVGAGVALLGVFSWTTFGIYAVTQLVAGALAGVIFRVLHPGE